MSTAADYAGRLVDMAAYRLLPPSASAAEVAAAQTLVGLDDGGELVAGIAKLAQKVLLTLCTPLGSKIYRPGDGTGFLLDAFAGQWRTVADVTQSFYAARLLTAQQIRDDELDTDPPDERYNGMELTQVSIDGGTVMLTIALTSLAGTTFTLLAPLTVPLT